MDNVSGLDHNCPQNEGHSNILQTKQLKLNPGGPDIYGSPSNIFGLSYGRSGDAGVAAYCISDSFSNIDSCLSEENLN